MNRPKVGQSYPSRMKQPDITGWLKTRHNPASKFTKHSETADTLPPELLLRIFSHLSPRSLISCSMVCRLWNSIVCSESLWKPICLLYFPKQPNPWNIQVGEEQIWKTTFFNRLRSHANSRKYATGLAKFGDFRLTLEFVGDSGRTVELSASARLREVGRHSSIVAFSGDLQYPDMRKVSSLVCRISFPAAHPDLLPPRDCPRRSAVLFSLVTGRRGLSELAQASRKATEDVGGCVTVHLLGNGLMIGEWDDKGSSGVAFVRMQMNHATALRAARAAIAAAAPTATVSGTGGATAGSNGRPSVSTSIAGSSSSAATASSSRSASRISGGKRFVPLPPIATVPVQASGLSAALILKEHRGTEFVYNTWRCVDLALHPGTGHLACQLIDPSKRGEHQPYDCEPSFRWRSGAFEGRLTDACYCDFVLFEGPSGRGSDASGANVVLWSVCEPAFLSPTTPGGDRGADRWDGDYDYEGPKFRAVVGDEAGSVELLVVKEAIGGSGYLVGAWLQLSPHFLALHGSVG